MSRPYFYVKHKAPQYSDIKRLLFFRIQNLEHNVSSCLRIKDSGGKGILLSFYCETSQEPLVKIVITIQFLEFMGFVLFLHSTYIYISVANHASFTELLIFHSVLIQRIIIFDSWHSFHMNNLFQSEKKFSVFFLTSLFL